MQKVSAGWPALCQVLARAPAQVEKGTVGAILRMVAAHTVVRGAATAARDTCAYATSHPLAPKLAPSESRAHALAGGAAHAAATTATNTATTNPAANDPAACRLNRPVVGTFDELVTRRQQPRGRANAVPYGEGRLAPFQLR